MNIVLSFLGIAFHVLLFRISSAVTLKVNSSSDGELVEKFIASPCVDIQAKSTSAFSLMGMCLQLISNLELATLEDSNCRINHVRSFDNLLVIFLQIAFQFCSVC